MTMILMKDSTVRIQKNQIILHQNHQNVHSQELVYLKVLEKAVKLCYLNLVSSDLFLFHYIFRNFNTT